MRDVLKAFAACALLVVAYWASSLCGLFLRAAERVGGKR